MNKPVVYIECQAYNHGDYIAKCLDGIVMQKTNFPFVAIVHDDASQDETPTIIAEYAKKYPDIIKPILSKENKYSQGILDDFMHEQCQDAKYVAICEGDDYWTDPLKLQKQIDILEADETLMLCCTNSSEVDNNGIELKARNEKVVKDNIPGKYNLRDFFQHNHHYPTASVVYRNSHPQEIREMIERTNNPYLSDWTQWIALLCFGDMYYLDEVTCAYRINPTSVTHSKVDERRLGLAKANFYILPAVASILPNEYQDIKDDLTNNTAWLWFNLANAYKHKHQYFKMAGCLFVCGIKDPKMLYNKIINRKK